MEKLFTEDRATIYENEKNSKINLPFLVRVSSLGFNFWDKRINFEKDSSLLINTKPVKGKLHYVL